MLKYHKNSSSYASSFVIILGMQDIGVDDKDRSYTWEFMPSILKHSNAPTCVL